MNYQITAEEISQKISSHIRAGAGKSSDRGTMWDYWLALSKTLVEICADNWEATRDIYDTVRQAHYFSAEFLMGRSTLNNIINLGIYEEVRQAMEAFGVNLVDLLEEETDAGLGNGGLGRLAACFLDSCATLDLPVTGYGILYRYGLFKQKIVDGFQVEQPDSWMEYGYPFLVRRGEDKVKIIYNDLEIWAVPHDMPVVGYGTKNVNRLRLWKAEPAAEFDFNLFNSQRFDDAVIERNRVNDIWRVLYPNDTSYDGKVLRLRQQYFFVSASLQDIIRRYRAVRGEDFSQFARFNSIQLNDTHPVIAIPELMRLLVDEYHLEWTQAWQITQKTFAYTNHTILSEALEKWDIGIFQYLFPRIYQIIDGLNLQFRNELFGLGYFQELVDKMSPLGEGKVRMAFLAIYGCYSVNGVAALHTEIIKNDLLKDWYTIWPEKFSNKTNGVAPRRWLRACNPELSALITKLLGSEEWVKDLGLLKILLPFVKDQKVMEDFLAIKRQKKEQLAKYFYQHHSVIIQIDSVFDVQVKRLHEYKRQLLNALYVLDLYERIKADPSLDLPPVTVIFGAKAAPGYFKAKAIIKFINEISRLIEEDPAVRDRIKVVFAENYNVSQGEMIFPAADISEQISTAGLEASGTGNMKFMINGAVTLGTYDGANVEIAGAVNKVKNHPALDQHQTEDVFIFGCRIEDMAATKNFYNPSWQYENVRGLKKVLDRLIDGSLNDKGTGMFQDLYQGLIFGTNFQPADPYYVLGDFEDYRHTRDRVYRSYQNPLDWAQKCWVNICCSGHFSSDRTINDYAEDIWDIKSVDLV